VLVVRFDFDVNLDRTRLAVIGDAVYFNIGFSNSLRPDEIWKSDGTAQGTGLAVDLGGETRFISQLAAAGGALYFVGDEGEGHQLWRSDGTSAGTELLRSGGLTMFSPLFTAAGPLVYFMAEETDVFRIALWATDGTAAGTRRVVQLALGFYDDQIQLVSFRGAFYFFAPLAAGYGLWTTDGTELGTRPIRMLQLAGEPYESPFPTVVGERLFFRASDGASGRELWASDGTAAGTYLVADIVPGPRSADPTQLAAAGGKLFFAAHDGIHGFELWTSDGTPAGTRLVHDIAPGAASSFPQQLTAAGNRLYFSADDGLIGRELWSLDLSAPPGACVADASALCLGGRFRVEAVWKDFDDNTGVGHTVALTADTGAFWFFGPENLEVILKVLDGRGLNQYHWVFYGALSSVEYALTATDVQTGLTTRYWNLSGQLASVADTTGFGPLGAFSVVERSTSGPPPRIGAEAAATGPCQPAATRLCLRGGRFAVEATWKDFSGNTGVGSAVALTGDTGYFWFFGADNVEVVLKVLDGTPVNGKHWVFYGALSSVEYTLRVTDTATGAVRTYTNRSGDLASVADTGAF
jgi:ELWxxDGT repeat protein